MLRRLITVSLTAVAFSLALSGCSIGVYKVPVQQGNLVKQEMLEKLKPGMTKSQVRIIMGQPLAADLASEHQWLYLYRKEKGAQNVKGYQVRVYFDESGHYTHYEGTPDKKKLEPKAREIMPHLSK